MLKRKPRIVKTKIKKLIRFFAEDINQTKTAKLVGLNRNTVNLWFNNFREKILEYEEN